MPRGQTSKDGDTNVSTNGYHYTRVDGKWKLTHHVLAEEILGRPIDTKREMVRFKDGDRTNLVVVNLEIIPKRQVGTRKRLSIIEAKLQELLAEKKFLEQQLPR
jgi:hypothetical protein